MRNADHIVKGNDELFLRCSNLENAEARSRKSMAMALVNQEFPLTMVIPSSCSVPFFSFPKECRNVYWPI